MIAEGLRGKRIAVTGATGFLGTALVERLLRAVPGYLTGTLLARRSLFKTVGLFNTTLRYGDAADWFLRAAEQGAAMELLPDVLMYHRIHHANLSRRKASTSREEFLQIVKSSLDRRRYVKKQPALYEFPGQTAAKRC